MKKLYHITYRNQWQQARAEGVYRADSLATEGFIHCSYMDQVLSTADNYYKGQTGLVLLEIDQGRLKAEVREEDLYKKNEAFPHIYGPLNLDSVVAVYDFSQDPDGKFSIGKPEAL